jgi:metal-responsive CopG/Arc/MetJ family transcriptional regulator
MRNSKVRNTINFGITLPKTAYEKTERLRGYMSRSKFILIALDLFAETIENHTQAERFQALGLNMEVASTPIKELTHE